MKAFQNITAFFKINSIGFSLLFYILGFLDL